MYTWINVLLYINTNKQFVVWLNSNRAIISVTPSFREVFKGQTNFWRIVTYTKLSCSDAPSDQGFGIVLHSTQRFTDNQLGILFFDNSTNKIGYTIMPF